mmetsp:Transcript_1246/g.1912  ORF Transcript_1246/g.1912 Transcript_1246/m.1912 type:complete len:86 (+) Transcript_1246:43-300(+)
MLSTRLSKLMLSENFKVFVGVTVSLGICAIPLLRSKESSQKKGHDLFSQEKPEAIDARQEALVKESVRRRQEKLEQDQQLENRKE